MCGGSPRIESVKIHNTGLSPRVRGKRKRAALVDGLRGSIPACAGEAAGLRTPTALAGVYPRVCGGSGGTKSRSRPPRGLSPRVRGKHTPAPGAAPARRSIPACAGEASTWPVTAASVWVYPRVCGGSPWPMVAENTSVGLSPRVRGKPYGLRCRLWRRGSIPACAGEASAFLLDTSFLGVYPRVCGGSPHKRPSIGHPAGLSPRVRGKPSLGDNSALTPRSIPACAGEAPSRKPLMTARRVYPRVCGGSGRTQYHRWAAGGLSPRVRGKRMGGSGASD